MLISFSTPDLGATGNMHQTDRGMCVSSRSPLAASTEPRKYPSRLAAESLFPGPLCHGGVETRHLPDP